MKQPNKLELYHHGILGQRWGVHRSAEQLAKSGGSVKLDLQFFAKKASSRKTIKLGLKEYAKLMSNINSIIPREQKNNKVIHLDFDKFQYTLENNFDGTYRPIGRKRIKDAITGLLERMNNGE